MTTKETPQIPMFSMYSIEELADRLGRAERYLVDIKSGVQKPRPKFRQMASTILGKSEEELFGPTEQAEKGKQ